MNRAELTAAKHAVDRAIKACEDAGLDTFILRQEAERIGTKFGQQLEHAQQVHRRTNRFSATAAAASRPTPEATGARQKPLPDPAALDAAHEKQQVAYENMVRALSAGTDAIIARMLPLYGQRIVRYSLHGALMRIASGLRDHPQLQVTERNSWPVSRHGG
jgi:hypothetical protein